MLLWWENREATRLFEGPAGVCLSDVGVVLADVDGEIFRDLVAMDFEADWPDSSPCVDVGLDSQTIDNLYVRPWLPIF